MLAILSPSHNPFFNLAAEELLLKTHQDNVFMLYRNNPSIIVGKHQNTLGEINLHYVKENNIPVVRRLSGGGTVYHDLNNINFSFIKTGQEGKLIDFEGFIEPIILFLKEYGIDAYSGKRNDILVDGFKISGNAEHVFKRRVLHHGTILFDSDLSALNKAIQVNLEDFNDKSVKSNRSRVANVKSLLDVSITVEGFEDKLFHFLSAYFSATDYLFTADEIKQIDELIESKFKTWEWNYAYSPKYSFHKKTLINDFEFEFELSFRDASLISFQIRTNHPLFKDFNLRAEQLKGLKHDPDVLLEALQNKVFRKYWSTIDLSEFIKGVY